MYVLRFHVGIALLGVSFIGAEGLPLATGSADDADQTEGEMEMKCLLWNGSTAGIQLSPPLFARSAASMLEMKLALHAPGTWLNLALS
jgi:hypothetical protein